jgi:hypothetical protein
MKIDSIHRPPETEMDSQEGYHIPSVPKPDMEFQTRFCPNDWKYGILGICTFSAQKNAQVKVHMWKRFV